MGKNNKVNLVIIIVILVLFGSFYFFQKQSQAGELAVITNSGSTNFAGYAITVNQDESGSVKCNMSGKKNSICKEKSFSRGTLKTTTFADILMTIGDVSNIKISKCFIKSVSFGTSTTVSYKGKTSPDISCISPQDKPIYQGLSQQVHLIEQQALK